MKPRDRTLSVLLTLVWLSCSGPMQGAAAEAAECCIPVAFVAVQFEVTTDTFKCCCPEQECVEVEGEADHRFSGYTYEYACGEGDGCGDPAAIECGEMGLLTDVEHDSTLAQSEAACECVAHGCWLMPPDCLDPNTYFWCICSNPPTCILSSPTPGCEEIDPGGTG